MTDADRFNELKHRIPALDEMPDVKHGDMVAEEVFELMHAVLDCVMQHNDAVRPRYWRQQILGLRS